MNIKDYFTYNKKEVIQIKITKYSDMARVYKTIRELYLDLDSFTKVAVDRFKKFGIMYMVYYVNNKNNVRFYQERQVNIPIVSIEYFLENVEAWELIKRL